MKKILLTEEDVSSNHSFILRLKKIFSSGEIDGVENEHSYIVICYKDSPVEKLFEKEFLQNKNTIENGCPYNYLRDSFCSAWVNQHHFVDLYLCVSNEKNNNNEILLKTKEEFCNATL